MVLKNGSSILIRKGTSYDIPAVHALVRELAIYEKAEEQHTTSIDQYAKDFDENHFEFIVAEHPTDGIVGMAFYYWAYSTWRGKFIYLEDFVVKEALRQEGIGQLLFDEVVSIAKQSGAKLLKWQVLDWNTPAVKFYEKNRAMIEKEWWNGKIMFVE